MSNLYNQKHYALLFKNMTGRHLHIKIDLFNYLTAKKNRIFEVYTQLLDSFFIYVG